MSDIDKFVNACGNNTVSEVRQMLSAGMSVNARHSDGSPALVAAMLCNSKEIVAELLSCRDIMLDTTHSSTGMTGLHAACYYNCVESARLFLAHPACTKHIVTMLDKDGQTAEMIASTICNQDCVRIIKEFIDKPDSVLMRIERSLELGDVGVEPARLYGMTLTQIGDAIESITAIEPTMEERKKTMEVEHKQELDKLEVERQTIIENHQIKVNGVLDKHAEENNLYENYCTEKKSQKEILQAELQKRLQAAQPNPPASLIPECPICMESMKPPLQIFTCSNGHLICSVCKPRVNLNKCHCEALYVGRATAMEQMVRQMLGIM